jgi:hypothetical protein
MKAQATRTQVARAHSYLRFSRPDQEDGDSIRRQTESVSKWCAANKVELSTEFDFQDRGVSGFRGKNQEEGDLGRFLHLVETKRIPPGDYLLFDQQNRLTRQEVVDAIHLITGILKAGIRLVDLQSGKTLDRKASATDIIETVVKADGNNQFSKTLSRNVGAAWNRKRHSDALTHPITLRCPAWLVVEGAVRESNGRTNYSKATFRERPSAVAAIKRIVKLSAQGFGGRQIAARLNIEKFSAIGWSGKWSVSTIKKITSNRALLGEYQPHRLVDGNQRVPDGDVIADYYPRILDDKEWNALQAGVARRRTATGAGNPGNSCRNLFGKLLRHGPDGSTMNLSHKHEGRTLMSNLSGIGDKANLRTFSYTAFETEFLRYVAELKVADEEIVTPEADRIAGELSEVERKIASITKSIIDRGNSDVLDAAARALDGKRKTLSERLDAVRQKDAAPSAATAHRDVLEVAARLAALSPDERTAEREKLKARIASLCKGIRVWITVDKGATACLADIELTNGRHYLLGIRETRPKIAVTSACTTRPVPTSFIFKEFKPDVMARRWARTGLNPVHLVYIVGNKEAVSDFLSAAAAPKTIEGLKEHYAKQGLTSRIRKG